MSSMIKKQGFQLVSLMVIGLVSANIHAACGVHDHNCYHASEPFNPTLDDLETGNGTFDITSEWQGEADINQHIGLPDNLNQDGQMIYGPFVSSNPDGKPVKQTPLGELPNIAFHNQQTVQFANATALANIHADEQPASPTTTLSRTEETIISGNVPPGLYKFALHSYNDRNVPDAATVTTTAKAGEKAYFYNEDEFSAAQQAAGHLAVKDSSGTYTEIAYNHSLAPDQVSAIEQLDYRYEDTSRHGGYDLHANGVYVIPDGVWNLHGVDPQQTYQFGTADMSQGFILNQGMQFNANPFDMQLIRTEGYTEYAYDANSGVFFEFTNQEQTGFGEQRLGRAITNSNELLILESALEGSYELAGLDLRGVANAKERNYNAAKSLVNCPGCSYDEIHTIHQGIVSGTDTHGLNQTQQKEFISLVAKGYSADRYDNHSNKRRKALRRDDRYIPQDKRGTGAYTGYVPGNFDVYTPPEDAYSPPTKNNTNHGSNSSSGGGSIGGNSSNNGSQDNGSGSNNSDCPCNIGTGGKYQSQLDFAAGQLRIERHYNSIGKNDTGFGIGWSSNLTRQLQFDQDTQLLYVVQADGNKDPWKKINGQWQGEPDSELTVTEDQDGYSVMYKNGTQERYSTDRKLLTLSNVHGETMHYHYNQQGQLSTVTDVNGLSLTISYNTAQRIQAIVTPDGAQYRYRYDQKGNLTQVIYPDLTPHDTQDNPARHYHYENIHYPNNLTGITDANGHRLSTVAYNSQGRVISSGLVATTNEVAQKRSTFDYQTGQTVVTDANGNQVVWKFENKFGKQLNTEKIHQDDQKGEKKRYDQRGNLVLHIDAEGHRTAYAYNKTNQRISKTEHAGSPQARTTHYQYLNDQLGLITQISKPSIVQDGAQGQTNTTEISYTADKRIARIRVNGFKPDATRVARTLTMRYNRQGQLIELDGARQNVQDMTRIAYYECGPNETPRGHCGQIKSLTNALGHTLHYQTYDAAGRATKVQEPNGVVTTYRYHPRGWLLTQTQTPVSGKKHARTTHYTYDRAGQLIEQTFADGIRLRFSYDHAHDLRRVTDNLGNQVHYSYDANGNRIEQTIINADQQIERDVTLHYDLRNRIKAVEQGQSLTQLRRDALGQLRRVTDPNQNPDTVYDYDAFGRLSSTLDALGSKTDYTYNVADQITQINTPNGATTQFEYDDLGNQLTEISPDRGIIRYTYDQAGNIINSIDARNINASYTYDALNRLINVSYPNPNENVQYQFDHCKNGLGRLCQVRDTSGQTNYQYDVWGNIIEQQTKMDNGQRYTTTYQYDRGNRVIQMTDPNGTHTRYERDALGRIERVTQNQQTVVERRQYRADGHVTEQTFGNGLTENRTYDHQGRLTEQTFSNHALQTINYRYDANGNVLTRSANDYRYDPLNRLVQDNHTAYGYDLNSNRISANDSELGYYSQSNQLYNINDISIEHDAAGNQLTDEQGKRYHYNQAGRLTKITDKQSNLIAEYQYNAFNQRTKKMINGRSTYYHYNQSGQLIAETGANTTSYLWLDSQPIAQLKATAITYLISDHLNTPRMGLDQSQNIVWQWHSDGFGKNEPVGTETVNLRFPGQYADQETGLFYNWHRYYNPNTGRYITSDPIGLNAGINTYGYVGGNPNTRYDLTGLNWGPDDWITHYIFGGGAPVYLDETGLASSFENAWSVRRIVDQFIDEVLQNAADGLSFSASKVEGYDVTNEGPLRHSTYVKALNDFRIGLPDYPEFFPELFPIGNGSLNMSADCSGGLCSFVFFMSDLFTDPFDLEDKDPGNEDLFFATPYQILHQWTLGICVQ